MWNGNIGKGVKGNVTCGMVRILLFQIKFLQTALVNAELDIRVS